MFRSWFVRVLVVALASLVGGQATADVIGFDGLGLVEGQAVPTIDGVTFINVAAVVQGGATPYAFFSPYGNDTGDLPPFSTPGNVFITNYGGYNTPDLIKTLGVQFPTPVRNASFLVCDIDGSDAIYEQLNVMAYNSSNALLATRTLNGTEAGDGAVQEVDFGSLDNISSLEVTLQEIGRNPPNNLNGFGIDNLSFTPTPEPSTVALLGIGAVSLIAYARRRRAA